MLKDLTCTVESYSDVQESSCFHGTVRFISVFIRKLQYGQFMTQINSSHNFTCFNIILQSIPRSPKWYFPITFSNKIFNVFLIFSDYAVCFAQLMLLVLIILIILEEV